MTINNDLEKILLNSSKEHFYLRSKLTKIMKNYKSTTNKELSDLLTDNRIKKHVFDTLGIYGGGFAIIHDENENILLLQKALYQLENKKTNDLIYVDIPYDQSGLIDLMFIMKRSVQSAQSTKNSSSFPEFFRSLPPKKGYYDFDQMFWLEHEDKLRAENTYEFLHCTTGEIYFFIIAWRYLLGEVKMYGLHSTLNKSNISSTSGYVYELFDRDVDSTEYSFFEQINSLKNKKNDANQEYLNLIDRLIKDWDQCHDLYDSCLGREGFISDWENIGLLRNGEITEILIKVVEFACSFINKVRKSQPDFFLANTTLTNLNETLREFTLIRSRTSTRKTCSDILKKTYIYLQKTIEILLSSLQSKKIQENNTPSSSNKSLSFLLRDLHGVARFPIIPYFYMSVIDADKMPKEHLVFPSSKSYIHGLRNLNSNEIINTPVVCLLTIKPLDVNTPLGSDLYLNKLNIIYSYFKEISDVISDISYHGKLVRDSERRKNSFHILTTLEHELKSHLTFLSLVNSEIIEDQFNAKNLALLSRASIDYISLYLRGGGTLTRCYPGSEKKNNSQSYILKSNSEYIQDRQKTVSEWLENCLNCAWQINLVDLYCKKGESSVKKSDVLNLLECLVKDILKVTMNVSNNQYYFYWDEEILNDESCKEESFKNLLARWMLASLSNTIKWSVDLKKENAFLPIMINFNVQENVDSDIITIDIINQTYERPSSSRLKKNKSTSEKETSTFTTLKRLTDEMSRMKQIKAFSSDGFINPNHSEILDYKTSLKIVCPTNSIFDKVLN
jgi:hypothetical protein